MHSNIEMLSKLDSAIGDGDHGFTIDRGFRNVLKEIEKNKLDDISSLLIMVGNVLLATMGGASGPLFGTFFKKMGEKVSGLSSINLSSLYGMFSFGYESLLEISNAKPGDKTLIDSLYPGVESLKKSLNNNTKLEEALKNMVLDSEKGMISTKELIATKGRARYLRERSIGNQDVGATSMYLIIKSFYESII
ncbi:PEP-dependent dihydroxyacetone kinase, ADP-binding subunit DhaL [subsurface metagenome]